MQRIRDPKIDHLLARYHGDRRQRPSLRQPVSRVRNAPLRPMLFADAVRRCNTAGNSVQRCATPGNSVRRCISNGGPGDNGPPPFGNCSSCSTTPTTILVTFTGISLCPDWTWAGVDFPTGSAPLHYSSAKWVLDPNGTYCLNQTAPCQWEYTGPDIEMLYQAADCGGGGVQVSSGRLTATGIKLDVAGGTASLVFNLTSVTLAGIAGVDTRVFSTGVSGVSWDCITHQFFSNTVVKACFDCPTEQTIGGGGGTTDPPGPLAGGGLAAVTANGC